MHYEQNTNIVGSEHREHTCLSVGFLPLTLKFQFFRHISITLNWLVVF